MTRTQMILSTPLPLSTLPSSPSTPSNRMRAKCPTTIIIFAFVLLTAIDNCVAIKCYKCAVTVEKMFVRNTTVVTPMCAKFDESDEYIVDCPFSTMCLKTISTLHLQNGQLQETITRGCAQQKDTTQVFRDRQWHQEHSVQEVYKEGCREFKGNNLAGSMNTHCYCRGELCNSSTRQTFQSSLLIQTLAVILLTSAMRCLIPDGL